ncbi:MAG: hypothetical protein NC238_18025 [Dehalobacter sp.]|nr:hypothetical protein [Dehalobacter sp.]
MELFLLIVGIIIAGVAWSIIYTNKKKKQMEDELSNIDFNATQKVMSENGATGIAIDENTKKICLIKNMPTVSTRIINYNDIISSEILEDSKTITKSQRGSQIGGAVVGGLLLGGVGAVIGGLSGKKQAETKVKKIDLQIIINDIANPMHNIIFLNIETKKDGIIYRSAIEKASHWQALLTAVIKQAEMSA